MLGSYYEYMHAFVCLSMFAREDIVHIPGFRRQTGDDNNGADLLPIVMCLDTLRRQSNRFCDALEPGRFRLCGVDPFQNDAL